MPTPKARILCTEDDADTRDMIVLTLSFYDYEVVCSENAEAALELARTQAFDLVLMDNWMPGINGTKLCESLRKFDQKTPVLFYSGAAYESDKQAALNAGAQGYLIKPCTPVELLDEIVKIIAESKMGQPARIELSSGERDKRILAVSTQNN
jgi:DNA-binding response OmpR family regulator